MSRSAMKRVLLRRAFTAGWRAVPKLSLWRIVNSAMPVLRAAQVIVARFGPVAPPPVPACLKDQPPLPKMTSRLAQCASKGGFFVSAVFAVTFAMAQQTGALSDLKREGRIACQPAIPYFCANVHVSCTGRTSVPTFPFRLRVTPAGVALDGPAAAEIFVEQYSDAQVEWSNDGQYVILSPARSRGYIKIFHDGRYVFRHYQHNEGFMSLGLCG